MTESQMFHVEQLLEAGLVPVGTAATQIEDLAPLTPAVAAVALCVAVTPPIVTPVIVGLSPVLISNVMHAAMRRSLVAVLKAKPATVALPALDTAVPCEP